jgi:hypothetical protein
VKTHVNRVLSKLGQTTRVGAVLEYQRLLGATGDYPRFDPPRLHPRP